MDRWKVLVMAPFSEEQIERLRSKWKDHYGFMQITHEEERQSLIQQADIIVGVPDIDEIRDAANLKWLQMTWAGTDKYTLQPGFPKQVLLTNASGAFGDSMAEYAIGAILRAMRHFSYYEENQKEGIWKDFEGPDGTFFGKKVLIFGAGDIGSKTAIRLKAFGADTTGVRRNTAIPVNGFDRLCTLEESELYLKEADIIIGCIPNSASTEGFLNEKRLRLMKKDSYLLNMGRGNFIVTEDLMKVLEEGWFQAVVLDVTLPEPLPRTHDLWNIERVMITPHISGPSFFKNEHTVELIYQILDENLERFLQGKTLRNLIPWNN